MIREGRLEDVPRAAPMRQRAWPEAIITEEGMRHSLQCVPQRAEFELFAYEEDGQIWGWATGGRAWWHHDPEYGTVTIAVDPDRHERRIASKLAEAADAHLPDDDFEAIPLDEWVREYRRVPTIDDDPSLAALVDGNLVAATMIRLTGRAAVHVVSAGNGG
jgi:ribosomal protein S18 acetylase RimI-like enzyme